MNLFFKQFVILTILLVAAVAIITACLKKRGLLLKLSKRILSYFLGSHVIEKIGLTGEDFLKEVKNLDFGIIVKTVLISLADIALIILYYGFLSLALGIVLTPLQLIVAMAFSMLAALLPISILGLGTRDAVLILIFTYFGLSKVLAISFSFLILFSSVVGSAIGLVCWLMRPLTIGEKAKVEFPGK